MNSAHNKYPDRVSMYNSTHLATLPSHITVVPREPFKPSATLKDDLNVLFHNWLHPIKGSDHKARLESFYEGQARSYDVFRHRFLHGRVPMIEAMPTPRNGVWVDLGGGTAANLEHLRTHLRVFKKVVVLDLCRPLLEQAKLRIAANKWQDFVSCVEGDATSPTVPGLPAPGTVDVITMSYSLTMIPDWEAALKNVSGLLPAAANSCFCSCYAYAIHCTSVSHPFTHTVCRRSTCCGLEATSPSPTSPSRPSTAW